VPPTTGGVEIDVVCRAKRCLAGRTCTAMQERERERERERGGGNIAKERSPNVRCSAARARARAISLIRGATAELMDPSPPPAPSAAVGDRISDRFRDRFVRHCHCSSARRSSASINPRSISFDFVLPKRSRAFAVHGKRRTLWELRSRFRRKSTRSLILQRRSASGCSLAARLLSLFSSYCLRE